MEKVSICYDVVAVALFCEEMGTQPGSGPCSELHTQFKNVFLDRIYIS